MSRVKEILEWTAIILIASLLITLIAAVLIGTAVLIVEIHNNSSNTFVFTTLSVFSILSGVCIINVLFRGMIGTINRIK